MWICVGWRLKSHPLTSLAEESAKTHFCQSGIGTCTRTLHCIVLYSTLSMYVQGIPFGVGLSSSGLEPQGTGFDSWRCGIAWPGKIEVFTLLYSRVGESTLNHPLPSLV